MFKFQCGDGGGAIASAADSHTVCVCVTGASNADLIALETTQSQCRPDRAAACQCARGTGMATRKGPARGHGAVLASGLEHCRPEVPARDTGQTSAAARRAAPRPRTTGSSFVDASTAAQSACAGSESESVARRPASVHVAPALARRGALTPLAVGRLDQLALSRCRLAASSSS